MIAFTTVGELAAALKAFDQRALLHLYLPVRHYVPAIDTGGPMLTRLDENALEITAITGSSDFVCRVELRPTFQR